jgi:hypothetical protein
MFEQSATNLLHPTCVINITCAAKPCIAKHSHAPTPRLPFHNLCSFQKLIFSTAAKIFSSTSRIKTDGEGVGFLNPLLAMAQVVNVSRPGSEPNIQQDVAEDLRLMCSALADKRGEG